MTTPASPAQSTFNWGKTPPSIVVALIALIVAVLSYFNPAPSPAPAPAPATVAPSPTPPVVVPSGLLTEATVKATAGLVANVARTPINGGVADGRYALPGGNGTTYQVATVADANGASHKEVWLTSSVANVAISGASVVVKANGVTLSNVDLTALFSSGHFDLTVTHSRLTAAWLDTGGRYTFTADEFHDANGGPHMQAWGGDQWHPRQTGLTIIGNYFHDVTSYCPAGTAIGNCAHTENVHLAGVDNVLVQHNVFSMKVPTPPVQVTGDFVLEAGPFNGNVTLDGNWFHEGGYFPLYFIADGVSAVTNNQFFSDSTIFAGIQFTNYSATTLAAHPRFAQAGNTLNGQPVSLPGGK